MNLQLNFNGKTLLKNWWHMILDNFTTIDTDFEEHRTAAVADHPNKSILGKHLGDRIINEPHIADSAIRNRHILAGSITSSQIANKQIVTSHIRDDNVTTAKLADGVVTTAKLANGSVYGTKLADSAVTSGKLANNAVTTDKINNSAVTEEKLSDDIISKLDGFQEHIDTPSQEIPNNSITWNKLDISLRPFVRNYMTESETYEYCQNNFFRAYSQALFLAFSSAYGEFSDAPPDTTPMSDGNVKYLLMVVQITATRRVQIAINLASFNRYIRTISSMSTAWTQIS